MGHTTSNQRAGSRIQGRPVLKSIIKNGLIHGSSRHLYNLGTANYRKEPGHHFKTVPNFLRGLWVTLRRISENDDFRRFPIVSTKTSISLVLLALDYSTFTMFAKWTPPPLPLTDRRGRTPPPLPADKPQKVGKGGPLRTGRYSGILVP